MKGWARGLAVCMTAGAGTGGATVELRWAVLGHGDRVVDRRARPVEMIDMAEQGAPVAPDAYVVVHPTWRPAGMASAHAPYP